MDQNTTTIIASIIAVLGTLGGAITGVLLSNNHTSKMEQFRIEQEKLKRDTAIIEEVYTLLTNIDSQIVDNIHYKRPMLAGKPLLDNLLRVKTLVNLYLPLMKAKLDTFIDSMFQFSSKVRDEQKNNDDPHQVWENTSEEYEDYKEKLNEVRKALEKLVR